MITNVVAVFELAKVHHPNTGIVIEGDADTDLSGVTLEDDSTLAFTFDDVIVKKAELESAEPLRLLREQRNQLLQQSDWRMVSDYPGANQPEWQTYRQSLRDITTQSPSLDADGNLTGITWPTPPND
jgi:hypothetical protein